MKSKAMKRIGNLYERIIAVENLQLADQKARRGKLRSYGVRRHDKNREANTLALHEALKNKTFKTSKSTKHLSSKTPKSGRYIGCRISPTESFITL
jgi:hypothetical protein